MASAALRAYADREAQQAGDFLVADGASASSSTALEDVKAPLVDQRVTISGLLARPDLNGKEGLATAFNAATGRYTIDVGAEQIAIKSANLTVVRRASDDATLFSSGTRVRIKGLASKPEMNGCGGSVKEWNAEKERFVVALDGSLREILLKAQNLERDRRERWVPEMPSAANLAHINAEQSRYYAEQAANANPFASMDPTGELFKPKEVGGPGVDG